MHAPAHLFAHLALGVALGLAPGLAGAATADTGPRIVLPDSLKRRPEAESGTPGTQPERMPSPAGTDPAAPLPRMPAQPQVQDAVPAGDLYDLAKGLFEAYAPEEIQAQLEFPARGEWDRFVPKLQSALAGDSFAALADCEPEARAVLASLRAWPEAAPYADWLEERLAMIEVARTLATSPAPGQRPAPSSTPAGKEAARPPGPVSRAPSRTGVAQPALETALPGYTVWLQRLRQKPSPARARDWFPVASQAFSAARVPPTLAWLAEVESSFNPEARSPAGAAGLYQLMPPTAKALGLRTWMPDERLRPAEASRAAATYLARLHERFGDWPLALAAYNAGEGRVGRALGLQKKSESFAAIAQKLPVETRLYVPRVYATIFTRAGSIPDTLIPGH